MSNQSAILQLHPMPFVIGCLESELQAAVLEMSRDNGWNKDYHDKSKKKNIPGFPDLILVRERVIWAELKREGRKPEPEQQEWIDALRAAGQEVYVWWPSSWPLIVQILTTPNPLRPNRTKDSISVAELRQMQLRG